jgi:hypothetical protein
MRYNNVIFFLVVFGDFWDYSFASVEDDDLREKALLTYSKLLPCIMNNPMMINRSANEFEFPHDAHQHYKEVNEITKTLRGFRPHSFNSYSG